MADPADGAADTPEYRRVAQYLREGIGSQRWSEDGPLPTDAELGARFSVSRQTVRRAYLDLVADGLVYRTPGKGTFVVPSHLRYRRPFETVDDLLGLSDDTELEIIAPLTGTYDATAAERLGLQTRIMYGMHFLRRHGDTLFCHTQVHLPTAQGALLEDVEPFTTAGARSIRTVIGALEEKGVHIGGAEQTMTARAATEEDARLLHCEVGHPLLHAERLYVDEQGVPVEFAVSAFLPENYTHRLRLGRSSSATAPEPHFPSRRP